MANKSSVTPELLADQMRASDPRISPDGRRIAYVVAPISRREEHGTSEIWIVGFDGKGNRRLTYGLGEDTSPRFSPDGSRLAFVSDRKERGKGQLCVMRLDGGEALQVTHRKSAVSSPSWSPSGDLLAFLSEDERTETEDRDTEKRRDQIVEDENLKRVRLYVIAPDGGEPRRVSPTGAVNVWDYTWSQDGTRLAAVSTPGPKVNEQLGPNDLHVLDLDGSFRTAFTLDSGIGHPVWSPTAERIAFLARDGRVNTQDHLCIASLNSGKYRRISDGYEGSILTAEWSLDGRRLLFTAVENIHGVLNELPVAGGRIRSLLQASNEPAGTFGPELSLDRSGRRFAVVRSDPTHPHEVFAGILQRSLSRATRHGEKLETAGLRPADVISWKSTDGLEIFGLLMLPAGHPSAAPHPLILNVHGGPASAFSDRFQGSWHDWAQLLAASGYAVLMPNPRGSTGRGAAFTDANIKDLGGMELQDLLSGVDTLIDRGIADGNSLGIAGWSHGGYIAAWAVTQTDRFKAAVMGAGVSSMVSDQGTNDIPSFNLDYFFDSFGALYADPSMLWDRSPLKYVSRVKTPTLVLHGEKDERVAASQGREFYRALKSLDVPAEMVIYPREPHGIREREHQIDVQQRILDWFTRYLVRSGS